MSFTFSNPDEIDYAKLGMCPICAVRFTHGCEHSNTQEAQEWLAAYIVAEHGTDVDEASFLAVVSAAEAGDKYTNEIAEHADWLDENRTIGEALA